MLQLLLPSGVAVSARGRRSLRPDFVVMLLLATLCLAGGARSQEAKPELQVSTGHSRTTGAPLVIGEENLLLTMDVYGEVKAWDLTTGKVLKNIPMATAVQRPVYVRSRKWVALAANDGLQLYRVDDLSLVSHLREKSIEVPAFDSASGRLFCTSPSPQGMRVFEVDLDTRSFVLRATVANPPYDRTIGATPQLSASGITFLDDGRLLVSLSQGIVILDPKDWSAQDRRVDERRRFARGRPGEIIATLKAEKIEILDGKTLVARRAALVPEPHRSSFMPLAFAGVFFGDSRGEKLVFRAQQSILFVDPESLAVVQMLDTKRDFGSTPLDIYELTPLGGADWLLGTWTAAYRVNLNTRQIKGTYGISTHYASGLTVAPAGFNFYLSSGMNKDSRLVELTRDGVSLSGYDENPQHMEFSPDGRRVAFQHTLERALRISNAEEFPRVSKTLTATKRVPLPDLANFKFSPDGRRVAVMSSKTTHIYDTETLALLFEAAPGDTANVFWTKGFGIFSPDGATFIHVVGEKDSRGLPATYLRAFDAATGVQRWQLLGENFPLQFAPDGSEIFALNPAYRMLVKIDANSGAVNGTQELPGFESVRSGFHRWAVSSDGARLLVYGGKQLSIFSLPGGEVLSSHSLPGHSLEDAAFFPRAEFFVTLSADNRVRFWKTGETEPLATLTLLSGGREWCLHTPSFQFQASPRAMQELYFVKGRSIIPIESLFEQFFTPGLAPRLFAGEKLLPPIDITQIKVPPTVRLALDPGIRGLSVEEDVAVVKSPTAEAKITVEAVSAQEAIAEVRLYHNGKLVHTAVRGLVVEDDPDARVEKRSFPLTLLPGENTLRAVAINAQRIESVPAELVVQYKSPVVAPVTAAGGEGGLQLHLVVVGVNQYRNPRFNLNYAVADATAFRDRVKQRASTIFTKINTHMLFDAEVTKRKIVETLSRVASQAGSRDVLVFYYAGHGVMSGDAQPKFYLVPHDLTQMYGADEKLAANALSSAELQELSRQIPAQKQLFILDACQSAGALESVALRGAAEQKAIAQLARSSGTHWLTATGSEQFASEFEQLGHGAFTYVLLQGLDGSADSGDGRVSVKELSAYLETEVPEVTQKHKGTPQFPSSYSFGQDFPIGLITK